MANMPNAWKSYLIKTNKQVCRMSMGGEKPLALYTTVGRRRGEAYLVEKRVEMMMIKMDFIIMMVMVIMMHGNTKQYKQTSKHFFFTSQSRATPGLGLNVTLVYDVLHLTLTVQNILHNRYV